MTRFKTYAFSLAFCLVPLVCNAADQKSDPMFLLDKIEKDPNMSHIFREVEHKIMDRGLCKEQRLGNIHCVWSAKKHILKTEYGIDWKSPAELNPGAIIE